MQEIISGTKDREKYMRHNIQNELIQLLSKKVENIIFKQIESARVFSVIMDTTEDITRKD